VSSGPLQFKLRQTFETVGGGTRTAIVAEGEPGGLFKLAEGAFKKQLESQLKSDGERLKKLLEG
jgi:hypothetical protein